MGDKNCQVACIHTIVLIQPGGEGVQNPGNFADVLYVWSLRGGKRLVGDREATLLFTVGVAVRSTDA